MLHREHTAVPPSPKIKEFDDKAVLLSATKANLSPKTKKFSKKTLAERFQNYELVRAPEIQQGIANYADRMSKRLQDNLQTKEDDSEILFRGRIHPEGTFKKVWETTKFFFLIYMLVYLPLKVAFITSTSTTEFIYFWDKAIDAFFFIDVILTFFTPVYVGVEMVFTLKEIAMAYLKSWFIVDMVSLIPFEELVSIIDNSNENLQFLAQIAKSARLLRLVRLIRLFKAFDFTNSDNFFLKYMEMYFKGTVIYLLLPNFLLMAVTIHLFSCFWYYIALLDDTNTNWVVMNNFSEELLLDLYIVSFYFVIQTFTTCGYGDILSYRNVERVFRIPIMFAGVFLYGIFSGRIVDYRSQKMTEEEVYTKRVQALERLMKDYYIPDFHYRSILEQFQENKKEEKKPYDFSNLSQEEKDRFDHHRFLSKFKSNKLFSTDIEHKEFVIELGRLLTKKVYKPEQFIYHEGDPAVYFYVIREGQVDVMMSKFDTFPIAHVKSGFFGEYELITGDTRQFTLRAANYCTLYVMEAQEFKKFFITNDKYPDLGKNMIHASEKRFREWVHCEREIEFFMRRKMFWKLILKNTKPKKKMAKFLKDSRPSK